MTGARADIRSRLMATFRVEAAEHLQAIFGQLAGLGTESAAVGSEQTVETLFRSVHTLKGAARSVGFSSVERLCQDLESVLSRLKRAEIAMSGDLLGRIREAAADLSRLLTEDAAVKTAVDPAVGAAHAEEPPPSNSAAATPPAATIRIATEKLEVLHARADDLLAVKVSAEERVREARELLDGLRTDDLVRAEVRTRALVGRLLDDHVAVSSAVDRIQEELRAIRMVAAGSLLEALPPMVAEIARERGKEVDFVPRGVELQVDRKVLEAMKDGVLHLVRNALDHGIEPPKVREAAGKPRRGRISVTVAPQEGRRIEITVADDGAGIDPAALKAAAVRARVLEAGEADLIPQEAAVDLAFSSGVSTSPVVTDLSGHGLGLAIVRDRVDRLGGRITLETRPGAGTTVRMQVPATVVTFRGLHVLAGGHPFLLPIESIKQVRRVAPAEIERVAGRDTLIAEATALPIAPLARLLGLPSAPAPAGEEGRRLPCAILEIGEDRGAVLLDEIVGEGEALVKELRPPLRRVRGVAAGAVVVGGALALILRPADILRALRSGAAETSVAGPPADAAPARVLVVDDSITTRTMERNLLETAGYAVRVAADGQEAWVALKSEAFDLVVSDVDMPRLDGFELTARIRSDPKLAEMPVVLVTALESREDKERGIEVGANAYVIKSAFDQSSLLEIIRRLA